jgi:hypothetical protein
VFGFTQAAIVHGIIRQMRKLQEGPDGVTEIQECVLLASLIIWEFPNILGLFQGKHFRILWRAAEIASNQMNFIINVTVTQTLQL